MMSSYSNQISVYPSVPSALLGGVSGWLLQNMLSSQADPDNMVSFCCDDTVEHLATYNNDMADRIAGVSDKHPLKRILEDIVFGLEDGDDFDFDEISLEDVLQGMIFESDGAIKWFEVEAAAICSHIAPGQVGGWCSIVTCDEQAHISTGNWLAEQRRRLGFRISF